MTTMLVYTAVVMAVALLVCYECTYTVRHAQPLCYLSIHAEDVMEVRQMHE